ncbi:hypothetical protein [Stenotrophomonas phage TS-10]|uniref:Tail fiber protein n=1 Tax=Stenotrophomonas phage TS-10 TaxID=2886106 RepID=A0AAE9C3G4_9CAUD|nr:hypothetical protein [Stenotrophomonas phage TS-10]
MIDDGRFSTAPLRSEFQWQVGRRTRPFLAYDMGSAAIRDPSGGLLQFLWTAEYRDGAVWLGRDGVEQVKLFDYPNLNSLSLTFDLAMNPAVAVDNGDKPQLWYYDSAAQGHVFFDVPGRTPFICLDERRPELTEFSDIILTYMRGDKVYQRMQRDRYTIEYDHQPTMPPGKGLTDKCRITAFSATRGNRMQWRIKP